MSLTHRLDTARYKRSASGKKRLVKDRLRYRSELAAAWTRYTD